MKFIRKTNEPAEFSTWKTNNPNATYHDLCDTKKCQPKSSLKDSLLKEQGYICCYCECRIYANSSHIEHFKPKGDSSYASLQLNYSNLHVSCTKTPTGSKDEHCGHKKGSDFSMKLVSPLESDCASHFSYTLDGHIGYTDDRGDVTVKMLHLDSELLNQQRKLLIDYFLSLQDDEIQGELDDHLDATKAKLGEFYTTIEYLRTQNLF